jgi:hypothetical protein
MQIIENTVPPGLKPGHIFAAFAAVMAKAMTYQPCPDDTVTKNKRRSFDC